MNMSDGNMVLIMIDECGDEVELERYTLQMDLDEDELQVWKDRKIYKASERYPEARWFYFEDRRGWAGMIARMIAEAEGYYPPEDEEWD